MEISQLSNQQLLVLIIFVGLGAFVLAAIFLVGSIMYVRKRRQQNSGASGDDHQTSYVGPDSPVVTGGQTQQMGSLLKSTGDTPPKPASGGENPQNPTPAGWQEAMRVLVNPQTQEIMVEVNGERFSRISEVKEKATGRRILETVAALLKFTGGLMATASGVKSVPVPQVRLTAWPAEATSAPVASPPAESPPPPPSTAATPPVDPAGQAFLSQLESKTESMRRSTAAPPTSRGFFRRRKQDDAAPEPELSPFNLAEQIDEILQRKLLQHQVATPTKIHTGMGGGIRIQVGKQFFEAVDDVTDVSIKALIKEAIEEWNR